MSIDRKQHPKIKFEEESMYFNALYSPEKNFIHITFPLDYDDFVFVLLHEITHWASYMSLSDGELGEYMNQRVERIRNNKFDMYRDITEVLADWVASDVRF